MLNVQHRVFNAQRPMSNIQRNEIAKKSLVPPLGGQGVPFQKHERVIPIEVVVYHKDSFDP